MKKSDISVGDILRFGNDKHIVVVRSIIGNNVEIIDSDNTIKNVSISKLFHIHNKLKQKS